jgi:2-polyprenyl-3-methyl-5-hydroxy-6-metoxy-1,4-benzoquinol methylase
MKAADRVLQRWRIRRALAWVPDGGHVLDVGCADGALFDLGRGRIGSGVGVDPEPAPVWRGPLGTERRTGTFPDAVRDGESFDAIVMLAVVEHVEEPQLKLWAQECARLLRPEGRVVITVPSPLVDSLLHVGIALRVLDGMEAHQHHGFDPRGVPELFATAGLEVEAARRFQLGLNNLFVLRKR